MQGLRVKSGYQLSLESWDRLALKPHGLRINGCTDTPKWSIPRQQFGLHRMQKDAIITIIASRFLQRLQAASC